MTSDTEGLEPCCDCEGLFADCDLDTEGRCSECRAIDDSIDETDAQIALGKNLLEMCERVAAAQQYARGAEAHWTVEIDGQRFEVRVTVGKVEA